MKVITTLLYQRCQYNFIINIIGVIISRIVFVYIKSISVIVIVIIAIKIIVVNINVLIIIIS